MTDKVQKIREEVERLMYAYNQEADIASAEDSIGEKVAAGKFDVCKHLLSLIDSQPEEPVSEDLMEAAIDYATKEAVKDIGGNWTTTYILNAFKAGAQWQREQMMAKAFDAQCFGFQGAALFSFRLPAGNYLIGSEVKVVVIKED